MEPRSSPELSRDPARGIVQKIVAGELNIGASQSSVILRADEFFSRNV